MLKDDVQNCMDCRKCMRGCPMLYDFTDSPKTLLENFTAQKPKLDITFACTTCDYCYSVCPEDISFKNIFFDAKKSYDKTFRAVTSHQKNSFSKHFTAKSNHDADVAFMPGCALSSYSPKLVLKIYEFLDEKLGGVNLLQQCCAQPTKAIGDMDKFHSLYENLSSDIKTLHADTIITACENCYMNLKEFSPEVKTVSLYEILAEVGVSEEKKGFYKEFEKVALHDPCPTRYETKLQDSVREVLGLLGVNYEEFRHNRENTECCGSGGMLEVTNGKLAIAQMRSRADQTSCDTILSYCQSCAESLSRGGKNGIHILDLVFGDADKKRFAQKKNRFIGKWYNRYKSKKMIEKL